MKSIIAIVALAAALLMLPAFLSLDGIMSEDSYRNADWLSTRLFDAWSYHSLHDFHEPPLWCPYVGGGYPNWQHPTDGTFSPFILTVALLGPVIGVKVNLLILIFLGGLGVFFLAHDIFGFHRWASLFAACSFMVGGWLPSMMLVGFYNLAFYFLIPLIVYFTLRAHVQLRWVVPAGLLLAIFIMQGVSGIYALSIFLSVLTLPGLFRRWQGGWRISGKPLAALVLILAIAAGAAAVKVIGMYELIERGRYVHGDGREGEQPAYPKARDFFYTDAVHFLNAAITHVPRQARYNEHGRPFTDEYAFLGLPWLTVLLFVFGAVLAWRRIWPLTIAGVFFLWLCFGPHGPVDLYRYVIWPVRPLREISQFYKYFNFFIYFVVTLVAAGAVDWMMRKAGDDRRGQVVVILCILTLVPFVLWHGALFGDLFKYSMPALDRSDNFHQVQASHDPLIGEGETIHREGVRPERLIEYYNLARNIGTIDWYADIYLPENAIPQFFITPEDEPRENPSYRGEVFFEEESNRVESYSFTANSQRAEVRVIQPGWLIFNQNYDAGWRRQGGEVGSRAGLLAVYLPRVGKTEVVLQYRPQLFYYGAGISLLTLLLVGIAWWLIRRQTVR